MGPRQSNERRSLKVTLADIKCTATLRNKFTNRVRSVHLGPYMIFYASYMIIFIRQLSGENNKTVKMKNKRKYERHDLKTNYNEF